MKIIYIGFIIFIYPAFVLADFDVGKKAINKVYDGDGLKVKMRLAHIDAPEIEGKCEYEKELAEQARDYTQAFVKYDNITIKVIGTGRYGRPIIEVRSSQGYLNQLLVDNGLARKYNGKRRSWCNYVPE
ncbi:MAG: thermonuclease family protein [Gammaproteobacteria bacterium]|nr:thermonuclease family protein [Gammaproteobacteria bacterium]